MRKYPVQYSKKFLETWRTCQLSESYIASYQLVEKGVVPNSQLELISSVLAKRRTLETRETYRRIHSLLKHAVITDNYEDAIKFRNMANHFYLNVLEGAG